MTLTSKKQTRLDRINGTVYMKEAANHAEIAHTCSQHLTDDIANLLLALQKNDVNIGEIVAVRDQLAGVAQQIDHAVQSYIRALHLR